MRLEVLENRCESAALCVGDMMIVRHWLVLSQELKRFIGGHSRCARAMPNYADGKQICRFPTDLMGNKSVGRIQGSAVMTVEYDAAGGIGRQFCWVSAGYA